jgi:hypothetical protein
MKTMKTLLALFLMAATSLACGGDETNVNVKERGSSSLAAQSAVRLVSANMHSTRMLGSGGGCPCLYSVSLSGVIELENLAYHKKVTVHYVARQAGAPDVWKEVDASYFAPSGSNRELWIFETPPVQAGMVAAVDYRFAIRYEVGGKTYWDNNSRQDYCTGVGNSPDHCAPTALGSATAKLSWGEYEIKQSGAHRFSGSILLSNVGYEKKVTVVYTTDHWRTVSSVAASYQSSLGGQEFWAFETLVPDVPQIEFAISYEAAGQTVWDNNLGRDYTVKRHDVVYLIPSAR